MHENPLRHPKSLVQVLPLLLPSEDDLRYWQSRLQELHSTSLPEREPFQTGTCVIELEAGLSFEEAQQGALKQGETVATLALLAVLKSLAEIQQDQKVVVGRVSSLRDRLEGGEEVPGPLLNTLPAAFDFASLNGCFKLLARITEPTATRPMPRKSLGTKPTFRCTGPRI